MNAAALFPWLLGRLAHLHFWPVVLYVGASAVIEHLFPPFPGDLAVALGAAIGFARHWPVGVLFASAVSGGTLGSALALYAGRWLRARGDRTESPRLARLRAAVVPAVGVLERRGLGAIVVSRFVPVGRAVIIVAAGYAGLSPPRAIVAAVAGAVLWDSVLFAAGSVVGAEIDKIQRFLAAYDSAALVVLALVLLAWGAWRWMRSRR